MSQDAERREQSQLATEAHEAGATLGRLVDVVRLVIGAGLLEALAGWPRRPIESPRGP